MFQQDYKMAKAGDKVKVVKKDSEEVEGILMPRPEILEKGITVIKLDSGYNVGIDDKKVKEIKGVEQYKAKQKEKKELKFDDKLPTVAILSTGGTISSRVDYRTGGTIAELTAEDFVSMCPELENIANIKAKKVMSVMTEDMTSKEWTDIAKAIAEEIKDVDGVVVTIGTDTLHFCSAALSFLIKDLNKPVVITAAQRSIDRGSSDSFMNLICAVSAAAKSDAAEVMTCMHGTTNDDYCLLIKGTKVRKMHTSRRDAFRPINDMPIAKVFFDGKIEVLNDDYNKKAEGKVGVNERFEDKVALVQVYPGMEPEVIDFYVDKGFKGIVLSATALGHVPQKLYPNIKSAIEKGVPVVIATQTLYGRTHPLVYSALRALSIELGCIFVEDVMPEVAYIKLGFVLGQVKEKEKIKKMMTENIAGEITSRSLPQTFLY